MVVDEKSVVTDYRFEKKERDALRVPLFHLRRGRIDWGGEGLIEAGFIAITPLKHSLWAAACRGLTGAATVRDDKKVENLQMIVCILR
jgi:hypothetical protein